ncbi:methylase of polypeptide subunit release factors [Aeromicrobium panaciterrae]|uniref:Methylase of polypeptide subunit release factors n=1 Tax=Aeromicrobium panaciterrae TaxID=363861 RepID=A0ABU1UKM9_9ACTN|nr:methyltransferase [Aeromicrobium panaciterrae]MDR7085743.1 methylase of polypeptide subunit release factors [Aeromicrobium panaciterrae]
MQVIDEAYVPHLRAALTRAGFTVDNVFALIGEEAHHALARNQVAPALRATTGRGDLATLVRQFALQVPVDRRRVDAALPDLVEPLAAANMLQLSGDEVRALVDIRPYGDESHDWWIVCDSTPGLNGPQGVMNPEHVLGISEASSSLAQLTVREPVGRALDLGTGCGVQALHLAQHSGIVVATDVNPRALQMARLTASLNELDIDVRDGSLFDPVAGEKFDLIATNPPFVISPPGADVLVYRDSGMPGDSVVRHLVENAATYLNDGGWCQILANWAHHDGRDWQADLDEWFAGSPLDSWVLQRELVDPSEYVEMWLADAGLNTAPDYIQRYDAWLDWFASERIDAVGFGWLSMRRTDEAPTRLFEEWTGEIAPPIGPTVAAWGHRVDVMRHLEDTDLLDRAWKHAPDLVEETRGPVGAEHPESIVLRLQQGVRRARQVDTVEAGLVSASDGDLTAGQILDALAMLLERDAGELRSTYALSVRQLVEDGFLLPHQPAKMRA